MEELKNETRQRKSTASVRKASRHGVTTQKMMAFKIDLDLAEKMQGERNKGRLINDLLRQHYEHDASNSAAEP